MKKTLLILATITLIPGLGMAFMPLRQFSLFPLAISIILSSVAFLLAGKQNSKKLFATITLIAGLIGITFAVVTEFGMQKKVTKDIQHEEQVKQSNEEALSEIDDLLE